MEYNLNWCLRQDFTYDEIKRQAECALFQKYSYLPSVAVRFPYVIGKDDYTRRLLFYIEHIMKNIPMNIDNLNCQIGFISSNEAASFLAWITEQKKATGRKAIISSDGEPAPYNGTPSYSINTDKANVFGYIFTSLDDWIHPLLDELIAEVDSNIVG